MASKHGINNLPEEMLIKIFTSLEVGDLLDSKLVCTRWLEIISTSRKLRKARKIFLKDCLLAPNLPPISVFKRSPRQFEVLTIAENVKVFGFQNLYEMWKGITEKIKRLKLGYTIEIFYPGLCIAVNDIFGDKDALELLFPSLQVIHFKSRWNSYYDMKSIIEEFNCVFKNISIKIDVTHWDNTSATIVDEYPTILKHIRGCDSFYLLQQLVNTENLNLQSLEVYLDEKYIEIHQKCMEIFSYIKKLKIYWCEILPVHIPINTTEVECVTCYKFTPDDYKKLFNVLRALPVSCKKKLFCAQTCFKFHEPLLPKITFVFNGIECFECCKSMSAMGGVPRRIHYNESHENFELIRPQLKYVTEFCVYSIEIASDSLLIANLIEMQNVKEIIGHKFGSKALLSWPQMPTLENFCGRFSNEPRHVLENFVFNCGAITKLNLTIDPIDGFDFPIDVFLCNLPRLRHINIRTTVPQIDAFVKNIPKCNTRIQTISMKLTDRSKFTIRYHVTEVTTDIFQKIPTLRCIYIIKYGVRRAQYYTLLKEGITKSENDPSCEICDEMTPVGLKYTEFDPENEYIQFKLVTPKDVKNELFRMEDGATVE